MFQTTNQNKSPCFLKLYLVMAVCHGHQWRTIAWWYDARYARGYPYDFGKLKMLSNPIKIRLNTIKNPLDPIKSNYISLIRSPFIIPKVSKSLISTLQSSDVVFQGQVVRVDLASQLIIPRMQNFLGNQRTLRWFNYTCYFSISGCMFT
jgi:hypothetical protein